mmetsp:Transcript_10532/g.42502  ORF Transcript_10532/g.42502 Transcript_10532/m.42502 type:complete len:305 (-) Transcript_10532:6-920(-)
MQTLSEKTEEAVAGHGAASEEILGHPVILGLFLEVVRSVLVDEDVDEHQAAGLKPPGASLEQLVVVLHVLEHFDGDDAIVVASLRCLERDHIRGDDGEVRQAELLGTRVDELLLGRRVGHARDLRKRVHLGHPERQGAPAASELQDILPVHDLHPSAVALQHLPLGLIEGHPGLAVQTAGVFEVLPEAFEVKLSGNLVVLLVRRLGLLRHGPEAEVFHELHLVLEPILSVLEVEQALGAKEEPDAAAKQKIGHQIPLNQLEEGSVERIVRGLQHGGDHDSEHATSRRHTLRTRGNAFRVTRFLA